MTDMLARYATVNLPFNAGLGSIVVNACRRCHVLVADDDRDAHWQHSHTDSNPPEQGEKETTDG